RQQLDRDFKTELAKSATAIATNERNSSPEFGAAKVNDGDPETYWATNDTVIAASISFEFNTPTEVNRILLQEYIPLGQRIENFIVEAEVDGQWREIDGQTTIGYKRILRFKPVKATKIRVNFLDAKGPLAISNIELYRAPNLLTIPNIQRKRNGMVTLSVPDKNVEVHYTLDGSEPTVASPKFENPFLVDAPTTLRAIAYDPETEDTTESTLKYFDIAKKDWKVIEASTGNIAEAVKAIDDNPNTFWATAEGAKTPQEVIIDLGKTYRLKGFTYWPIQERYPFGIITDYEFSVSSNGINWKTVAEGEFGNIVNNRIGQTVDFDRTKGRFIKLKGEKVDDTDFRASFGEIGVVTERN
ncbi:MAG TPA: discoidin domain-containing protein, partial [Pricia sp.]|nr:discoidin domain-containing protein [Pricia sp.]